MKAKTRHRLLRCATALSLAVLLATLVLWKRSYHADEMLELKRQATAGRTWRGVAIDFGSTDGTAGIAYHQAQIPLFPNNKPPSVNWSFGVKQNPFDALHSPRWSWWSDSGTWRWWGNFFIHYDRRGNQTGVVEDFAIGIPHWLLVLSIACLSLLLIRRARFIHFGTAACQNCGYNMTANVSGVCPECGSKIQESPGLQRSGASFLTKLLGAIGVLFCLAILGGGLAAAWSGADGLGYALTSAPRSDRNGDLFGASLLCVIGVVTSTFSVRWFYKLYRFSRRRR